MIKLKCLIWAHNFKKVKGFKNLVCVQCKHQLHPFLKDEQPSEIWKTRARVRRATKGRQA